MAHCVILEPAKNVSKLARAQNVIESQRRCRTCRVASVCSVASATLTVIQQVYKSIAALKAFRQAASQPPAMRNWTARRMRDIHFRLDSTKGCAFLCVYSVYSARVKYIVLFFSYFNYLQVRTVKNTRQSKQSRQSEIQKQKKVRRKFPHNTKLTCTFGQHY